MQLWRLRELHVMHACQSPTCETTRRHSWARTADLQLMGMQGALEHGRLLHLPALAVECQRAPLSLGLLEGCLAACSPPPVDLPIG